MKHSLALALIPLALAAWSCSSDSESNGSPPADGQDAAADSSPDASVEETGADAPQEAAPDGPATMNPGEVRDIEPRADGVLEVVLPSASADEAYIAIVFDDVWKTKTTHQYTLQPKPASYRGPLPGRQPRAARPAWLARARMPWLFPTPSTAGEHAPPPPPPPAPPVAGDHRSFKVAHPETNKVSDIDAECIRVSDSLAVWLDRTTTTPKPADITTDKLDGVVTGFETTVLPRHRKFFGKESDVDQDGLVHILYTPLFADTGVVAYVSPCDQQMVLGCPAGNGAELIYATPPDQIQGAMMNSVSSMLEVIAHEFQHGIYFYRKYMLNSQTTKDENLYIHEALAGLGEDLSGYGNGTFFVWEAALEGIADVSGPDLLDSAMAGYDSARDGSLRGAGYLLYRYLYDQAGSNEFASGNAITDKGGIAWLNSLVDGKELGTANLEKLSSRPVSELLFDWYTALAVSNRPGPGGTPLNSDPRYNYLPKTTDPDTKSSSGSAERHGVDLFETHPMTGPLSGPAISAAEAADGVIRAGGVEYLRFAGSASGKLAFSIQGGDGTKLRMRLLREK